MASAEKRPREGYEVVLVLTPEEAEGLLVLTGSTCGSREIYRALHYAGIRDTEKFHLAYQGQVPRLDPNA